MKANQSNQASSSNVNKRDDSKVTSKLQDATTIHQVPSGQTHQKKVKKPAEVNHIVSTALSGFESAEATLDKTMAGLDKRCLDLVNGPTDSVITKQRKKLIIGNLMLSAYRTALAQCDASIEQMKKVSGLFQISGEADQGLGQMLGRLGLDDPKAVDVVVKLREKRAAIDDKMRIKEAWTAFTGGYLDLELAEIHGAKIRSLQTALATEPSQRTPAQKIEVMNESSIRTEHVPLFMSKRADSVAKYMTCIELLTDVSLDSELFPDQTTAKVALKHALETSLTARYRKIEMDLINQFLQCRSGIPQAFEVLRCASDDDWRSGKMDAHVERFMKMSAEAEKFGNEALPYINETIALYEKALFHEAGFSSDEKATLAAARKKCKDFAGTVLMHLDDFGRSRFEQSISSTWMRYDLGLRTRMRLVQTAMSETKRLHEACSPDIAKLKISNQVPEHLVNRILPIILDRYENIAEKLGDLVKRFNTHKPVKGKDDVVKDLKVWEDRVQGLIELVEAKLGEAESAGATDQGTDEQAQAWLQAKLREIHPAAYDAKKEINAITEKTEKLAVDQTPEEEEEELPAEFQQSVEGKEKHSAKQAKKALAAAEKAFADDDVQKNLELWEAESKKHEQYAMECANEGESPRDVEEEMKLAATNELKLSEKKAEIAEMFRQALDLMAPSHPKFQHCKNRVDTLTGQAGQHRTNSAARLNEGEEMRIRMTKALPPTHSRFHYLCDKQQIKGAALARQRDELPVLHKDGKPRINRRTNEPMKDYIDEYVIERHDGKKFVAHFHYRSKDAPDTEITECHFKTWEHRKKGGQHVRNERLQHREVEIHRGKTNRETLMRLQAMANANIR